MPDRDAVLFANDAFYIAFAGKDLETMDQVWATEAPVTCIHPGWGLIEGREKVMASWQDILSAPSAFDIRCRDAAAFIHGDVAYVVCTEVLQGQNHLIATNVFIREGYLWKMIHHQAGAMPAPKDQNTPTPPKSDTLI